MNASRFKPIRVLGKGIYGITSLAKDTQTLKPVAIKKMEMSPSNTRLARAEISALQKLSEPACHPNIVCYLGSYEEATSQFITTVYIVMEYIEGVPLTNFFINNKGLPIVISRVQKVFEQLLKGLQYIHSRKYAHRDIKPDNIMITAKDVLKYIDFGLSCVETCMTTCESTCTNIVGTELWAAPEHFLRKENLNLQGAQAHDIWSLGVVLFQLVNDGTFPFDENDNLTDQEVRRNISMAPSKFSNYSNPSINVIVRSMLTNDPTRRPNIQTIIQLFNVLVASEEM